MYPHQASSVLTLWVLESRDRELPSWEGRGRKRVLGPSSALGWGGRVIEPPRGAPGRPGSSSCRAAPKTADVPRHSRSPPCPTPPCSSRTRWPPPTSSSRPASSATPKQVMLHLRTLPLCPELLGMSGAQAPRMTESSCASQGGVRERALRGSRADGGMLWELGAFRRAGGRGPLWPGSWGWLRNAEPSGCCRHASARGRVVQQPALLSVLRPECVSPGGFKPCPHPGGEGV